GAGPSCHNPASLPRWNLGREMPEGIRLHRQDRKRRFGRPVALPIKWGDMIGMGAGIGHNQQRSFFRAPVSRATTMLKTQSMVMARALVLGILAVSGKLAAAALPSGVPSQQQSLEVLGASAWQAAGYRGQGMRIAVLDTGFHGYRSHLGKCLPAIVECRSF